MIETYTNKKELEARITELQAKLAELTGKEDAARAKHLRMLPF